MVAIKAGGSDTADKKGDKVDEPINSIASACDHPDVAVTRDELSEIKLNLPCDTAGVLLPKEEDVKMQLYPTDNKCCEFHNNCLMLKTGMTLQDRCIFYSKLSLFCKLAVISMGLALFGIIYGAVFRFEAFKINPFLDSESITIDDPGYLTSTMNLLITVVVVPLSCVLVMNFLLMLFVDRTNVMDMVVLIYNICFVLLLLVMFFFGMVVGYNIVHHNEFVEDPLKHKALMWVYVILIFEVFFIFQQTVLARGMWIYRDTILKRFRTGKRVVTSGPVVGFMFTNIFFMVTASLMFYCLQQSGLQYGAPLRPCVVANEGDCPKLRVPAPAYFLPTATTLMCLLYSMVMPVMSGVCTPLHIINHLFRVMLAIQCTFSTATSMALCMRVYDLYVAPSVWALLIIFNAFTYLIAVQEVVMGRLMGGFHMSISKGFLRAKEGVYRFKNITIFDATNKVIYEEMSNKFIDPLEKPQAPKEIIVIPKDTKMDTVKESVKKYERDSCKCPKIRWNNEVYKTAFPIKSKTHIFIEDFDNCLFFEIVVAIVFFLVWFSKACLSLDVVSTPEYIAVFIAWWCNMSAMGLLLYRIHCNRQPFTFTFDQAFGLCLDLVVVTAFVGSWLFFYAAQCHSSLVLCTVLVPSSLKLLYTALVMVHVLSRGRQAQAKKVDSLSG